MDLTLIAHKDFFYTPANKVWGGGILLGEGVILNHPVPLSIFLSKDKKLPDSKLLETPSLISSENQPKLYLNMRTFII